MQEINLLQNKLNDQTSRWEKGNRWAMVLLSILLIAVLGGTVLFFLMNKAALDEKAELDKKNTTLQTELDRMKQNLTEAISFQAQTKNIETLISRHVVWNKVLDELSTSIFKNSEYVSINSTTDGELNIEGRTADYSALGKVLLALETSKLFQSVKLMNTTPTTGTDPDLNFTIRVMLDKKIFIN